MVVTVLIIGLVCGIVAVVGSIILLREGTKRERRQEEEG